MRIYSIKPHTKPRMTHADRRIPRKCVQRYWDFKDELRLLKATFNNGEGITFIIPMPKSWSKKKKREMDNMPHQQTPDIDNLVKGFFDAIFDEDKHIWHVGETKKIWGKTGLIVIKEVG